MATLLYGGDIVTWGENCRILSDQAVLIDGGIIQAIGPAPEMLAANPDAARIDARGQLIMPGNICAHTHFYGAYARGMAIPGPAPADFPQILDRLWWPLDKALDADSIRASALVSLVDAVKHGTTTLIDHHASPNAIDGSLDIIADAVNKAGLRAVLCYEVTDRDGPEKMEAGIAENLRFMRAAEKLGCVAGTFGLHASLTLSDETLRRVADVLPDGAGVHVHVAEHEADEEDSLRRSGQRVVNRLAQYGLWNDHSIAAHGVHINAEERRMLREAGVWLTHQPRSNMNNGVGAADIDTMLSEGMRLCLGNDGMGNNMWAEWKSAYLLHKVVNRDPRRANGADIARMATVNNAQLVDQFFPGARLGVIEVGARADLILVDYHPYTPLSSANLPWHILFGFESSMVTMTMVDGELLMLDRQLLTLNEAEIAAEAMELTPHVWDQYTRNAELRLQS